MKKLTKNQISRIYELIKIGKSLNNISKELDIKKSTVYYYYRKKFPKRYNPIKIVHNDRLVGEFMGAFSGDGNFYFDKKAYHYSIAIHFSSKEEEYARKMLNLVYRLFRRKPNLYRKLKDNAVYLRVYGKEIYQFIKKYLYWGENKTLTIKLKHLSHSDAFLKAFVRGLFDTDGNVGLQRNRAMIGMASHDIVEQLSYILRKFGINYNNYILKSKNNKRKSLYCVYLESVKNLKKFDRTIGLSNPLKREKLKYIINMHR